MASRLPSGNVTLLFTDVEGSTRLLQALGPEAYAAALAEHRRIVRNACAAEGGIEVDNQGDALFFAFPTPSGATAAAAVVTEALATGPMQVRIGLHTGAPLLTDEGYVGADVHLAARIAATGYGGQVVVSATTAKAIDLDLTDLGEHRLKDIDGAVALFQLGTAAFPPLKTISNTNLPRPASSFVGRERELAELLKTLRSGVRATTLTGPGGTGKTRLAIEAATAVIGDYKAGVFWVGLAAVRDWRLVVDTIAQALGARDGLHDHIGAREMLLLLDNFEHVVDAAPEISALLRTCPNLAVIVTSRELLRIDGEVEHAVPPLAAEEAVALFCARSGLAPDREIAELCTRLDELPLAVELAAARARAMSPGMILERLSLKLDLLKGSRDADPRQQTLRATIEWSYELLTPAERELLARLSVFAGGWTLDAAEVVARADIDTLQSLVEKSLVRFANGRYQMLVTIRDYALELAPASDVELARRHAQYFCDLAVGTDAQLRGAREDELLDVLDAEQNNIRAALQWSAANDRDVITRIATAMARYWWMRGTNAEARRWLESAVEHPDLVRRDLLANALAQLAFTASETNDWETVHASGATALAISRELELPLVAFRAITPLAEAFAVEHKWDEADRLTEEGIEHARAAGDGYIEAAAVFNYGESMRERGELERARSLMEEALRLSVGAGFQEGIASSEIGLGSVMREQGDLDAALRMLRQAVAGLVAIGFKTRVSWGLIEIAGILVDQDEPQVAARVLGAALAISEDRLWDELSGQVEARLATALGEREYRRLRAEGEALSPEEAIALAGVPNLAHQS
jgi:predicted ATPase